MADRITLRIDGLAFGGDAVGRDADGRVIFVDRAAPGDLVEVRLSETRDRYARGEAMRVVEPGSSRAEPECPLQSQCGGCPWMHVTKEAQLSAKQSIVERALRDTGARVLPIVAAPDWLGYRVRARMTAQAGRFGFAQRGSHEIIDVDHCPALVPALDQALQTARESLRPHLGEGGQVAGLCGTDGHVQLGLFCGESADRRALDAATRALITSGAIVGTTGDLKLGVSELTTEDRRSSAADGFQQANVAQNRALQKLVVGHARAEGKRVLELYAGDGNFTCLLAQQAHSGVAVEGDIDAARRLKKNLNAISSARTFQVIAESCERALAHLKQPFDVVVLDPPRAGCKSILTQLAARSAARIVYVSCDPMTLARDLMQLKARGYHVDEVQPIDMMPHTSHIEMVAALRARD